MILIQSGNSIQRLAKASFSAAKRKYKKRAICKIARKTFLDMAQTAA